MKIWERVRETERVRRALFVIAIASLDYNFAFFRFFSEWRALLLLREDELAVVATVEQRQR